MSPIRPARPDRDPNRSRRCWTCNEYKPKEDFIGVAGKTCSECRTSNRPQWTEQKTTQARYRRQRIQILEQNKQWKEANTVRYRSQQREYRKGKAVQVRREVIARLGGGCACCQETEELFLQIDHVNGGGWEHRRQIGVTNMWRWLKKNDYPDGFQLLCANCNSGRYRNGGVCPHQGARNRTAIGSETP